MIRFWVTLLLIYLAVCYYPAFLHGINQAKADLGFIHIDVGSR